MNGVVDLIKELAKYMSHAGRGDGKADSVQLAEALDKISAKMDVLHVSTFM
jgi:hypothetical protein